MRKYTIHARCRKDTNGLRMFREGFGELIKVAEEQFPISVEVKSKDAAKEIAEGIARDVGLYDGALVFDIKSGW